METKIFKLRKIQTNYQSKKTKIQKIYNNKLMKMKQMKKNKSKILEFNLSENKKKSKKLQKKLRKKKQKKILETKKDLEKLMNISKNQLWKEKKLKKMKKS